jgi:DNA primase
VELTLDRGSLQRQESLQIPLPAYSKEVLTEVSNANDIVDVIGASLDLASAGTGRFKALCPFHNEKTPSFSVSRDRQMFYCFGCEKGGDVFRFVQDFEGLTFPETVQRLADRAGIHLPAPTGREQRENQLRTQLLELGTFASRYFRETLQEPLKGGRGRQYLKGRAFKDETVKRFGLGYALDDWSAFSEAARGSGYTDEVLEASSLVRRSERGRRYDFFRNRLMFPIRDVAGNVVAFGGRDLSDEDQAKYINSQENTVYKKSRVLYGLYQAREAMRRDKTAVLVEGYFDVMRCFEAGVETAVAPCGTALTAEQATIIHRYATDVVVMFDADAAGIRAAMRSITILTGAGLTVRALILPDGKDPDDYVQEHGAKSFQRLINEAEGFVPFYVRTNEARAKSIEGRTDVARELFDILLAIDDEMRRDEYLKQTADALRMSEFNVRREFEKRLRGRPDERPVDEDEYAAERPLSLAKDDIDFVGVLLANTPLLAKAKEALTDVPLPSGPLPTVLEVLFTQGVPGGAGLQDHGARTLWAAASNVHMEASELETELVEKRIRRMRREALQAQEVQIQEAIREAERAEDEPRAMELLQKHVGLRRKIDALGAT